MEVVHICPNVRYWSKVISDLHVMDIETIDVEVKTSFSLRRKWQNIQAQLIIQPDVLWLLLSALLH